MLLMGGTPRQGTVMEGKESGRQKWRKERSEGEWENMVERIVKEEEEENNS